MPKKSSITEFRRRGIALSVCLLACCLFVGNAHSADSADSTDKHWLNQPMSLADARHLLGRTGFGASPEELVAMTQLSRNDAVNAIVDAIDTEPELAMPSWVEQPAPHYWTRGKLSQEDRQAFDQQRNQEIVELRRWWINNMLETQSPQTERLVLFWHDHFATSYEGVNRRSHAIAKQNQLFREMGAGSYRALLKSIIRDPAMLLYLNNQSNRKGKPNENFARELLELFTLGEGNYSEAAVKEAARALTGYGLSETRNLTFRLHGYRRDLDIKTLFGNIGQHDGDDLIDIILEQPAAAEHLVKKFWHAFVSDSPPNPEFVSAHAKRFRDSDYHLGQLYASVISSEEFWNQSNRLSIIKSPATLLIGTARSLEYPKRAWAQLPALHALLGMDLFAPPNVSGWNEGAAFVVPGRLLNRQLAVQSLLSSTNHAGADGNMMMSGNNNSMMMSAGNSMQTESSAPLRVRVAGHFYEGAPHYKVSLLAKDKSVLWSSEEQILPFGYDTQTFGKMRNFDQLAWIDERFFPEDDVLAKAALLNVEFLNDAAGKTGDRNLFVESIVFNDTIISSSAAHQESECPPKRARYSGRLYCAGTIEFDLAQPGAKTLARPDGYSASSVSVLWSTKNKKGIQAIVALENVQTPTQYFHTVSFTGAVSLTGDVSVSIDSHSCWPDCIKVWPECAYVDTTSREKSLQFPLDRRNAELNCHYDSLSQSEQELVRAILVSLPVFVDAMSEQDKKSNKFKRLSKFIWPVEKKLENSDFLKGANRFSIHSDYQIPVEPVDALAQPYVAIDNLHGLERVMDSADLSLPELLIGGVPVSVFPEFSANADPSIEAQLDALISHPVYQVY